MPAFIQNAPQLRLGLELYLDAFLDLSSCRDIGMAEGPIPWSSMADYCRAYELEGEQRDNLFYHVRALDVVYLRHKAAKLERKHGKSKGIRSPHKSPRQAG